MRSLLSPSRWLVDYGRLYPGAWRQFDSFLGDREALGGWPEWCWCPLAGSYAVVSGGGENRVPPERGADVGILGALAAWRVTQGVYRYDVTAQQALWETPVEGAIPVEVLHHLPEWCVYVDLCEAPPTVLGYPLRGYWAHLEWDAQDAHTELRLVLDCGPGPGMASDHLIPVPLRISGGATLPQAMERTWGEAAWQAHKAGVELPEQISLPTGREFAPLVSLLLYLCSETAELRHGQHEGPPARPEMVRTRKGPRMFPPDQPRTWDVAYRLGPALRAAVETADQGGDAERQGLRAHVRRAHWHTYWTGSGRTVPALRWLSPILVGAGELVPVVHRMRGKAEE